MKLPWGKLDARYPFDQASLERAHALLEYARHRLDLEAIGRCVKPLFANVVHTRGSLAALFPLYGLVLALTERRLWDESHTVRHRAKTWLGLWIARVGIGHDLRKSFAGRPGWNDCYMTLWFITGSRKYAEEIYRRARAVPGPAATPDEIATAATAKWMVASVRARHSDFDLVMTELEYDHGRIPEYKDQDWREPSHVDRARQFMAGPVQQAIIDGFKE